MRCFDTQILIWGIRGEAQDGQEEMVPRTKKFIHSVGERRERVIVPAPALAEFLVGSETKKARTSELADIFGRQFAIAPFDLPCVKLAAEIQERSFIAALIADGADRHKLKVDAMIIAIAKCHGATSVVTNDPHFERLAYQIIKIMPVPDVEFQPQWWES